MQATAAAAAEADDTPIIRIERLDKYFGEFHVLRDVSLEVRRGERIVICGP